MVIRAACFVGLAALTIACVPPRRPQVIAPTLTPGMPDITALALPAVDSATYNSLAALLDSLKEKSSLLSELTSPEPRMYSLFRDLEETQAKLNALMSVSDAQGLTIYDRIIRMSARHDSLFRLLDQLNRRAPRP